MKDVPHLTTYIQPMILDMITQVWSDWLQGRPADAIFQQLLVALLPLIDSDYGFTEAWTSTVSRCKFCREVGNC